MAKLDLPAKTTGSDPCTTGQFLERWPIREECIARIFTLRHSSEIDAIRQFARYILHAVNGKIDAAIEQSFVNFLRE